MNMESIYEYGSRAGFWRLHRLFTERAMPVTVFAVATAMARNPQAVAAMNEAGWEIASHGYKWIDYRDTPAEMEARAHRRGDPHPHGSRRRAAARLLSGALVGQHHPARLRGRRLPLSAPTPMPTICPIGSTGRRGPQLDRRPTRSTPTTCASPRRRVSIPATSSSPISRIPSTRSTPRATIAPKMLSIGLHCRLVGRPGPRRCAGAVSRLRRQPRQGVGRRRGSTSRATGSRDIRRPAAGSRRG